MPGSKTHRYSTPMFLNCRADAFEPHAILKDWAANPFTATVRDRLAAGHLSAEDKDWVIGTLGPSTVYGRQRDD